jgi:hypothetical protein
MMDSMVRGSWYLCQQTILLSSKCMRLTAGGACAVGTGSQTYGTAALRLVDMYAKAYATSFCLDKLIASVTDAPLARAPNVLRFRELQWPLFHPLRPDYGPQTQPSKVPDNWPVPLPSSLRLTAPAASCKHPPR